MLKYNELFRWLRTIFVFPAFQVLLFSCGSSHMRMCASFWAWVFFTHFPGTPTVRQLSESDRVTQVSTVSIDTTLSHKLPHFSECVRWTVASWRPQVLLYTQVLNNSCLLHPHLTSWFTSEPSHISLLSEVYVNNSHIMAVKKSTVASVIIKV